MSSQKAKGMCHTGGRVDQMSFSGLCNAPHPHTQFLKNYSIVKRLNSSCLLSPFIHTAAKLICPKHQFSHAIFQKIISPTSYGLKTNPKCFCLAFKAVYISDPPKCFFISPTICVPGLIIQRPSPNGCPLHLLNPLTHYGNALKGCEKVPPHAWGER